MESVSGVCVYVFLEEKRLSDYLGFRALYDCLYYSTRLARQGDKITTYCLPREIIEGSERVY